MKLNAFFQNLKLKLKNIFGKNKKLFILSVSLVCAILVSVVLYPSKNKVDSNNSKSDNSSPYINAGENYRELIENKIKNMLLNLSEVTSAEVMIMCESTEIYEYLKNHEEVKGENNSISVRDEVVYQKEGSNSKPIVITAKMPKITGVWIIINQVSASTKLSIINSIESVLNIDKDCISILQE